jgi:hypothetical protein
MTESREVRQRELARLLLLKARQDLALVQNVGDVEAIADEAVQFRYTLYTAWTLTVQRASG